MIKFILVLTVFINLSTSLGEERAKENLNKALTKIVKPKEGLELITSKKGPFQRYRPYRQWKRNINETLDALKIVKKPLIKFEGDQIKKINVEHYQDFNEYMYKKYKKEQAFLLIGGSVLETAYLIEGNPKGRRSLLKRINKEKKKLTFLNPLNKFFGAQELHYFKTVGNFICNGDLVGLNKSEIEKKLSLLKKNIFDKNISIKMQQRDDITYSFWEERYSKRDLIAFRIDFPDKRYLLAQYSITRGENLIYSPLIRYYDKVKETYFNIPNIYMKGAIGLTADCNLNFGWRGYLHRKKVINPFKALEKYIVFDKSSRVIKTITAEEPRKALEAIYSEKELKEINKIRPKFKKPFVKVAVIDTGIDYNHPVLAHKLLESSDIYSPTELKDKNRKLKEAYAANKFLSGILRKKGLSPGVQKK